MKTPSAFNWSEELISTFEKALEVSSIADVREHVISLLNNCMKYTLWRSIRRGLSISEAMNQPITPMTAALDRLIGELGRPLAYDSYLLMHAIKAFCDYVMENRVEVFNCVTSMQLDAYCDDPSQFMRRSTNTDGTFVEEFEKDKKSGPEEVVSIPIFDC